MGHAVLYIWRLRPRLRASVANILFKAVSNDHHRRRVIATSHFTGQPIDMALAKEALHDLLALHDRMVTIDNIQKTVAQYYKLRVADMVSKRRTRSIARPRQISMALAKELTNHSLPEIGDAFGGRDHTTVLHACRKVAELRENNATINEEYAVLLRSLST